MKLLHAHHQYHAHDVGRLWRSDFWRFELLVWTSALAGALVGVFIPVIMVQAGYSIGTVMVYFAVFAALDVPLNFLAARLVRTIGAKAVTAIGTIATAGFFLALLLMEAPTLAMLVLLVALSAVSDAFYWVGHLYLFFHTDRRGREGEDTGIMYLVRQSASIVAPAAGAGFILFGSERLLLAITMSLFLLSLIPLFALRHARDRTKEIVPPLRRFFARPEERKDYASIALYTIHGAADSILWPLFVFTVFGTLTSVAGVALIVSLASLFVAYGSGKIAKANRERTMIAGSAILMIAWVLRLAVPDPWLGYGTVLVIGLFSFLVSVPIDTDLFERAREVGPLSISTYRNAIAMAAFALFFAVLAALINVFRVGFFMALLAVLGIAVVNYAFLALAARRERHAHA